MKHSKFPYEQENEAVKARAEVEKNKANLEASIQKAKHLCHWNSHDVKVKDGRDIIIETHGVCMCPGKDFKKCADMPDCYGHGAFEFEGESED